MICAAGDLSDEAAVAIHEAAHAVAFCRLRLPFARVELLTNDPLGRGGVVFGYRGQIVGKNQRYIVGLLAGTIAEATWTLRPMLDVASDKGQIDCAAIDQMSQHLTPGEADALVGRAVRMVDRNARHIGEVADQLILHRHLTEADVLQILDQQRIRVKDTCSTHGVATDPGTHESTPRGRS